MRQFKFYISLLLGLSLIISYAKAEANTKCLDEVRDSFKKSPHSNQDATKIINTFKLLIDWKRVEKFNSQLKDSVLLMMDRMSKVDIRASTGRDVFCNPDRKSEFYLFGENKAVFNQDLLKLGDNFSPSVQSIELQRARTYLGLHILIGAAGFFDENYEKTIGLSLLSSLFAHSPDESKPKDGHVGFPELYDLLNDIFLNNKSANPLKLADGGSTGVVGSGGDLQSIFFKISLLEDGKVYRLIDQKCKDEVELEIICREWPTKIEYLKFLTYFNLESSDSLTFIDYNADLIEKGIISIRLPKISQPVLEAMTPAIRKEFTDRFINSLALITHEKHKKNDRK